MLSDPARLAACLQARLGSQPQACEAVARVLAPRIALGGLKPERERPDAAMLFLGPRGAGKAALARHLASVLYADDCFCSLDLAAHGGSAGLLGPGAADGCPEGLIPGFVRRHPFGVIFLDHADQAAPEVKAALAEAMGSGWLGRNEAALSLRHAVVILSVDDPAGAGGEVGFRSASATEKFEPGSGERCFEDCPGLLRTLTVVAFRPLVDKERLALVRRQVERTVVQRLRQERGLHVVVEEAALQLVARRMQASRIGCERLEELVDELVIAPLVGVHVPRSRRLRLVEGGEQLAWQVDQRPTSVQGIHPDGQETDR
ncbi:MAG: ATP-dependent Clp protease ATP-binding subunit [Deltaproteobacteria bacterium]|nr:ATP-dependent Clp protease ATP-binding subunit [Deltaproteobacteria bacterium]